MDVGKYIQNLFFGLELQERYFACSVMFGYSQDDGVLVLRHDLVCRRLAKAVKIPRLATYGDSGRGIEL